MSYPTKMRNRRKNCHHAISLCYSSSSTWRYSSMTFQWPNDSLETLWWLPLKTFWWHWNDLMPIHQWCQNNLAMPHQLIDDSLFLFDDTLTSLTNLWWFFKDDQWTFDDFQITWKNVRFTKSEKYSV